MDEVVGIDGQPHNDIYATVWRWRRAYQNEFAARMDWTIKEPKDANHPPVARLAHAAAMTASPGRIVHLSASGSSDPDGDALTYRWFTYREAGTYGGQVEIENATSSDARLTLPKIQSVGAKIREPRTLHVILEVTDSGTPALTRYARVIVTIEP